MSTQLYFNPFIPAFSNLGVPLPASQLHFFVSGTLTRADIFSDKDMQVPLPNPVIADMSGKYPDIYLDENIVYRVMQLDSNGNTIGDDIDPYIPGSTGSQEAQEARLAAEAAEAGAVAAEQVVMEQVGLATAQVNLATIEATNAATAADRAEAARDTAVVNSNVYATIADGRAAVADGETFLVEAANDGIADLHRRTDANNSVFIETYASQTDLSNTITSVETIASQSLPSLARADALTINAIRSRPLIHNVTARNSIGSTRERAAKSFTAHETLNDNQHIKVGQIISTMFVIALIQPDDVVTAKVIKRATGGNHFPETGDDVEVSRSETKAASEFGVYAAGATRILWSFPIEPFLVEEGNDYLFLLETVGSNIVFAFLNNQAGYTQAQSGYLHTGTAWGNQGTGRPLGFGFGGAEFENINDISDGVEKANASVNSTRQRSLLRDVEKLFLQKDPWSQWKYPGTTTTAFEGKEGLANILGQTEWSAGFGRGVAGVDFGHITSPDDMTSMENLTSYFGAGLFRLQDNTPFNAGGGWVFKQHKIENGGISYNTHNPIPLLLEDCYFRGASSSPSIYGVTQPTALANPGKITIKNCTITGFRLAQLNIVHADVIDCDLQFSAADIIVGGWANNQTPDFSRPILVQGNLMRLPANNQHPDFGPLAHADIWQINSPNGLTAVGNTLYMPSTESGYDEGSTGTTSALANGGIANGNEAFYLGNILVGGAFTAFLGLANQEGSSVKNHFYINNICGTGGVNGEPAIAGGPENYNAFGDWNIASTRMDVGRVWKNIGFFYNRGADGYPVRLSGVDMPSTIPQAVLDAGNAAFEINEAGQSTGRWVGVNGIFNYDKNELTDRSLELILTLGREHGVEIIDPVSHDINPAFDLGELRAD